MIKVIVWIITCFISTFGFAYLYYRLTNCRRLNVGSILIFIIGASIITVIKYFEIPVISFCSFFIFYPILFYFMNPLPIKQLIYYVFVVWFLGMVLDLLVMLFVSWLHNAFEFDLLDNWTITSIILTFIVFFCLFIVAHIKKVVIFVNKLYNRLTKIKYSDLLIVFLILYIFISAFVILTSLPNLSIDILLSLLIFLIIVVFVFLIKYKITEEEIEKYLKTLKENNDFYITVDDENRIFKHNLMAKMLSIKSVSNKKARKLIDDFLKSYNSNMDFSFHIKDMPYGLNGIIYEKIYPYMGQLNIKIDNKIDFDIFSRLKPRRYNVFVEKMVIVLDNAIQASLKSKTKLLILNLYYEDNQIIIDIKNTFETNLSLDDLGKINYSTKDKKGGLGLFSALRDNEVNLSIKIINDLFVTKIIAKQNLNEDK